MGYLAENGGKEYLDNHVVQQNVMVVQSSLYFRIYSTLDLHLLRCGRAFLLRSVTSRVSTQFLHFSFTKSFFLSFSLYLQFVASLIRILIQPQATAYRDP
jgi:hypothetical protein